VIAPLRSLGRTLLDAWGLLGRAPGWRYQVVERWGAALAEAQPLPRLLPGRLRIDCDLRELVDRVVYFRGLAEPVETWILLQLLRPGMVVVDAGANIGQYTLLAAQAVGPTGRVFAFEPIPPTFARLERHVRENRLANVVLRPEGLWDASATLKLAQPEGYADNAGTFTTGVVGAARYESVRAVAFDDVAAALGCAHVDVVKMDIEGAEPRALLGMRRMLERDHPFILLELNRSAVTRAGARLDDVWNFLTGQLGYRAWRIGETPALSGALGSVDGIEQENALFFTGEVPSALAAGWSLAEVLRWSRSGS
jgi:FkbM family methyltransferase